MALTDASVIAQIGWTLAKSNTGFLDTTQGPDSVLFEAQPDTATVTAVYATSVTLTASGTATLDLRSFTDLAGNSVTLVSVYAMIVKVTGSGTANVVITPGASNGLTWFWTGTPSGTDTVTPKLTVTQGGVNLFYQAAAKTVDATHRNLDLLNSGAATSTVLLAFLGGT